MNYKPKLLFLAVLFIVFVSSSTILIGIQKDFAIETHEVKTVDGVGVVFDVIYKKGDNDLSDNPIAIIIHGFSANRKTMKSIGLELANKGFVSVLVDLRGHGDSEGYMIGLSNNVSKREQLYSMYEKDINAVIGFLGDNNLGDLSRIVLIGHSMGGGTVIFYGSKHSEVVATVGIAPGLVVTSLINTTTPRNLLLIASKNDKIVTLESVMSDFYYAVNGTFEPNKVYVFNGSKRMLFVDDDSSHLGEIMDPDVLEVTIEWVCNATNTPFDGLVGYASKTKFLVQLSIYSGLFLIGAVYPFLVRSWGVSTELRPRKMNWENFAVVMGATVLGGVFLGFLFSLIIFDILYMLSPLLMGNFTVSIILGTSLAQLVSAYVVLRKKLGVGLFELLKKVVSKEDVKILWRTVIVYSFLLIALFYFTLGTNIFLTLSVSAAHLTYYPLFFVLLLPAMFFDEIVFRYLNRPRVSSRLGTIIVSFAVYFVARYVVLIGAVFMISVLIGFNFWFFFAGLTLLIFVWIAISFISEVIREYSGNILTQSIVNAVFLASIAITFTPVIVP